MANQSHLDLFRQGLSTWNAWRAAHPDIQPDLTDADLSDADLANANLGGADLSFANLSNANLAEAILDDAYEGNPPKAMQIASKEQMPGEVPVSPGGFDLRGANLSRAILVGANLTRADLSGANMDDIRLEGASLEGVDLRRCNVQFEFVGLNLNRANLSGLDLNYGCM